MRKSIITHTLAGMTLALTPALVQAQDSASVDVEAELVDAPATFSITALSNLDYGQISLPVYQGTPTTCRYNIGVAEDGATTVTTFNLDTSTLYFSGQVDPNGCYNVGNGAAAHFEFDCTSENVSFSFSATDPAAQPEWYATIIEPWTADIGGTTGSDRVLISQDGTLVASGFGTDSDIAIDCSVEGAGTYDLYAAGALEIVATADTSSATLGAVNMGLLTVDAIY